MAYFAANSPPTRWKNRAWPVIRRTILTAHGFNVRRIQSYVWPTNNDGSSILVRTTDTSTGGLRSRQTLYRDPSTPIVARTVITYNGNGIQAGEQVQWQLLGRSDLRLHRLEAPQASPRPKK